MQASWKRPLESSSPPRRRLKWQVELCSLHLHHAFFLVSLHLFRKQTFFLSFPIISKTQIHDIAHSFQLFMRQSLHGKCDAFLMLIKLAVVGFFFVGGTCGDGGSLHPPLTVGSEPVKSCRVKHVVYSALTKCAKVADINVVSEVAATQPIYLVALMVVLVLCFKICQVMYHLCGLQLYPLSFSSFGFFRYKSVPISRYSTVGRMHASHQKQCVALKYTNVQSILPSHPQVTSG
jgi:hypothetical protein